VLFTLTNDYVRPYQELGWPQLLHYPAPQHSPCATPRAIFNLNSITAEIWCISDLLAVFPDKSCFQSSSARKMDVLGTIYSYSPSPADLVIAVGTAASYPIDVSQNGSVIIGSQVFLHNGHPNGENKCSDWNDGPFDTILESSLPKTDFEAITQFNTFSIDAALCNFAAKH
jgi:hypothetical protein